MYKYQETRQIEFDLLVKPGYRQKDLESRGRPTIFAFKGVRNRKRQQPNETPSQLNEG